MKDMIEHVLPKIIINQIRKNNFSLINLKIIPIKMK